MTSFTGLFSSVHVKEQEVIEKKKTKYKNKKGKKIKGRAEGRKHGHWNVFSKVWEALTKYYWLWC